MQLKENISGKENIYLRSNGGGWCIWLLGLLLWVVVSFGLYMFLDDDNLYRMAILKVL